MADLPNNPNNRTEEYLAKIGGLEAEVPPKPWSRKEAYLKQILENGGGGSYVLPIASSETLGGVKVGENLSIDSETGVLSATGGSSITPVQTTGTSTTDVMSQDATTKMIFPNISASNHGKIVIDAGGTTTTEGNRGVAIGVGNQIKHTNAVPIAIGFGTKAGNGAVSIGNGTGNTSGTGVQNAVTIGSGSNTYQNYGVSIGSSIDNRSGQGIALGYLAQVASGTNGAIAFGARSNATRSGEINVGSGSDTSTGFNNTYYRLISGVHDGTDLHDCATVAQGNTLATSAPTTSTVGVLGQLYTDTTDMHTYQCTAISGDTYTWTQRW